MPVDRKQPWAKLAKDVAGTVTAALPLIDHCLDVGVAMTAVLTAWTPAMKAAAGRPLTQQDLARLAALAALHDVGKANRGFQAGIGPGRGRIGHTAPVAALLFQSVLKQTPAARALQAMIDAWGANEHFAAVMAHHGQPLDAFRRSADAKTWMAHTTHWQPGADGDPTADVLAVIDAVRARWPIAWDAGAPLPDAPRFVALFAGLVTLADWLGSDTGRFPVEGPYGTARTALRDAEVAAAADARGFLPLVSPMVDFATALEFTPHDFQAAAADDDLGPVALIEAETGSGKTEAALWRWLELRRRGDVDGLFFALPTRSAAVQLHARVDAVLKRVWKTGAPEAVLAVPGYLRSGDATGQALPDYRVRWDGGEPGGAPDARWAAERANQFLAARVAVGTIDQALLGILPVRHALFRTGVLSRSLLVVDEVHASDAYMGELLERLIDHHVAVGGRVLLLSATLGAEARGRLLKQACPPLATAAAVPYPALSGRGAMPRAVDGGARGEKRVAVAVDGAIDDAQAIAGHAIAAARAGAAVLVVRNSVRGAVAVAQAVAGLAPDLAFAVGDVPTVHHGRFAASDRLLLDAAVDAGFGKGRARGGRILVGTQTLEQSLDIDADFLITDLAPMDVLLQRIGRLHRHRCVDRGAFADARVLVLRPADRDLTRLLDVASHGLGGRRGQGAYPNLLQIEATLRLIEHAPVLTIPRDNRRLVEQALHPDALAAIADGGGTAWGNHGTARSGGVAAQRQTAGQVALDLSVPFTRLTFAGGDDAATRLGARDLLVDLAEPLDGAFGSASASVTRIAIPAFMAGRGTGDVTGIDRRHFALGDVRFRYDRWGLHRDA